MKGHADALIASYREASVRHRDAQEQERRRARLVAYGRIVSFTAAAACAALAWPRGALWLGAAGAGLAVAFFALVYVHSRIDARERWHDVLAQLNDEAAARVARQWDRLPRAPVAAPDPSHPYAEDLDLFGRASLFQLLGSVGSESGRRTLRSWLLAPAGPATVVARQEAVREFAGLDSFREEFSALGRLVDPAAQDLDAFITWAASPGWMHATRSGSSPPPRRLRAAMLVLLVLQVAGVIDAILWIYPLVAGRPAQRRSTGDAFTTTFTRVFFTAAAVPAARRDVRAAGGTPVHVAAPASTPGAAVELRADRRRGDGRARTAQASERPSLPGAVPLPDQRAHAVGFLRRSIAWSAGSARAGRHLREWFDILGEADALSAIASLAHDNPTGRSRRSTPRPTASRRPGLGHPLLPEDHRVVNDVEVGPPGNAAPRHRLEHVRQEHAAAVDWRERRPRAGGRARLRGRALAAAAAVATSMRVQDSLEAGVSYFMAALRRLKLVVDAARQSPAGPPRLLYLLDEVLQGTNTAERQVAVRHILAHLLALPVLGAVTTHDLELAVSPELRRPADRSTSREGVDEQGRRRATVLRLHAAAGSRHLAQRAEAAAPGRVWI